MRERLSERQPGRGRLIGPLAGPLAGRLSGPLAGRFAGRFLVMVAVAVVTVVGLAPAAGAHASLVSTEPAPQSRLAEPPTEVVLQFDEAVEATLGGVRLYDADERRIPVGEASRVAGDDSQLRAPIDAALDPGLYVVTWRATSADGHPVSGAFTFQVGDAAVGDTSGLLERLLAGEGTDTTVGTLLALARLVGYAGLALLIGGFAFLGLAWPAGAERPGVRGLLWLGWTLAVLGALGTFVLQGPYVTGDTVGAAADTALWADVADTRVGEAALVRLGAALVALVLIVLVGHVRRSWWQALAATTAGVLSLSVVYAGHSYSGRLALVGLLLGVTHVAAITAWLGGLAYLAVAVLRSPRAVAQPAGAAVATEAPPAEIAPPDDVVVAVRRFSTVALVAVVVAVVTGVLQAWRLLEPVSALWDSDYGRLLLAKTLLVALIVGLAALARRAVRRRWLPRHQLRQVVLAEVAVAAAVLAVTAVLVGSAPASPGRSGEPFSATLAQGDTVASITIDPAQAGGGNALHVYISPPGGSLARVEQVEARLSLPERELGPIPVPLGLEGVNHFSAYDVQLPYGGTWQLELVVTTGAASSRFAVPFTVG